MQASAQPPVQALVLDLRMNPGGLLDVAVETVSLFQPKGSVVSTQGRREPKQELDVLGVVKGTKNLDAALQARVGADPIARASRADAAQE